MTIEQKCNNEINKYNYEVNLMVRTIERNATGADPCFFIMDIQHWSYSHAKRYKSNPNFEETVKNVHKLIEEADEAECLTSGARYIRETKKKFMENK